MKAIIGRVSDTFDLFWVAEILDELRKEGKLDEDEFDNLFLNACEER